MQKSCETPDNKTILWKNTENVPGRPVSSAIRSGHLISDSKSYSPKKGSSKSKHRKTSSTSSFQEFQESTEDAWDIGDDDICLSSVNIHSRLAQTTAMKVLNNHSKGTLCSNDHKILSNPGNNKHESDISMSSTFGSPKVSTEKGTLKINDLHEKLDESSPQHHISKPSYYGVSSHLSHGPGIGIRQIHKRSMLQFTPNLSNSSSSAASERENARLELFKNLLQSLNTDIKELRKISWSGVPYKVRPLTWKLLSGYLPTCLERRESFLLRKKEEYNTFIKTYYDLKDEDVHHETFRQIHIDVPRMSPLVPLFQQEIVQKAFERILYILAIRHPASGYVQGMNDLVTPFFVVFLQDFVPSDANVACYDVSQLSQDSLQQVEADSYWCMDKLLDGSPELTPFLTASTENTSRTPTHTINILAPNCLDFNQ